jgi:NADH-quinone oxidoreductase subunit N
MIHRAPMLTITFAIFLLSLVGIPPLIGYMVKFQIFAVLYRSAMSLNNSGLLVLLVIGLLNTVLSLFYYVRVLKVMILDPPPEGAASEPHIPMAQRIYALLLAAVVTVGMLGWDVFAQGSSKGVKQFRAIRPPTVAQAR